MSTAHAGPHAGQPARERPLAQADINAMLVRAGLGDRLVRSARSKAPGFTAGSQASARSAREQARRVRSEWLLRLSAGDVTPPDLIRAACTPELSGPLRKLRLDHVMRAHEHARNLTGIHVRLARVHAWSGTPGRWCAGPHKHSSPRTACTGFHPQQMTVGWLLNAGSGGRRFRAWSGLYATVWEGFPRRPHGAR